MSSGAYYEMRRKAESAGFGGKTFDKIARNLPGYKAAKGLIQAKRAAGVAKAKGRDTQPYVNRIKDLIGDMPPDIEVGWGTP